MTQLRINSLLKFGLASTAIGLVSGCQTLGLEKTQSESVSTEVSKVQVAQELSKFDLQMQALETSPCRADASRCASASSCRCGWWGCS